MDLNIKRTYSKTEIVDHLYNRFDIGMMDIESDIKNVMRKDLFIQVEGRNENLILSNKASDKIAAMIRKLELVESSALNLEELENSGF